VRAERSGCGPSALFGLIVLAVLAVLIGATTRSCWAPRESIPFDSNAWKADVAAAGGASRRLAMLDDLIAGDLLVGRSRADVAAILGPPDEEDWSPTYPFPGWDLGVPPGWEDSTGLMVEFDDKGIAINVYAPVVGLNTRPAWEPRDVRAAGATRNSVQLTK
jgi:hypothetical protein